MLDILKIILSFLPRNKQVFTFVSKRWNRAYWSTIKNIYIQFTTHELWYITMFKNILIKANNINRLKIRGYNIDYNEIFNQIVKHQNIIHLELCHDKYFNSLSQLKYCSQLTYLKLCNNAESIFERKNNTFKFLNKLRYLSLSNCKINDQHLVKLNILTNLISLDLSHTNITNLSYIKKIPLITLNLSYCKVSDLSYLNTTIQTLILIKCPNITEYPTYIKNLRLKTKKHIKTRTKLNKL